MAVNGQVVRLIALALATGTLLSVGAGTAAAAPSGRLDPHQLTAHGDGSVLTVTINVPSSLRSTLGSTIVQNVSLISGDVTTVTTPVATSSAALGLGSIPRLADLTSRSTMASLMGKQRDSSGAFSVDQAGLSLRVLPLLSAVADPSADGLIANSESALAHLRIGGLSGALPNLLAPVNTALTTVLGTQNGTVGQAAGSVGSTLVGAIGTLNGATGTSPAQTAAITAAVTSLTGTLNGLTGTLTSLTAATDIVSLGAITSNQTISRSGGTITSTVANTVHDLNILNGLVKIEAITATATSAAGGVPGSAVAVTQAPVLKVSIAKDALTALLDQKGINVGGTVGSALPPALQDTVNTALAAATDELNKLVGLHVSRGLGSTSTAPDGTAASAKVGTTTVTVNPQALVDAGLTTKDKPLVTIDLVTASTNVTNQVVARGSTPVTPVNLPTATTLPRTGTSLPAVGLLGTLLMGGALVVRRRRAVNL